MKPLTGLYRSIPFLLRYPVLFEKYFPDQDRKMCLRYVSIMQDLVVLYTWINKPRLLSSGHIMSCQRNMLKYYKSILDSVDSQCFVVEQEEMPVCQFDILPSLAEVLHSKWARGPADVSLRYLADFRIPPSTFRNSLSLCLDYLQQFSDELRVFVSLPSSAHIQPQDLEAIGFVYIDTHYNKQDMIKLFSYSRT